MSDKELRTPRDIETRDNEVRFEDWAPPQILPDPAPDADYYYRYIRTSMVGQPDNMNVSMKLREGWEPVKAKDHPELMIESDVDSRWGKSGAIEIGGLLLCKCPKAIMDQRAKYYQDKAEDQIRALDNDMMRVSDPRMPILAPSRHTRTTGFGGG